MERERGGGGLREGVMVSLQLVEWPFGPLTVRKMVEKRLGRNCC